MSNSDIIDRLRLFFQTYPESLACAYLFGSMARGDARPDSDIDVAVLYIGKPPSGLAGLGVRIADDLERYLGQPVDLVVLNRASVDLVHRILLDGVLVLDRDPSARIRFEVKTRNAYFDLKPILDCYRRKAGEHTRG